MTGNEKPKGNQTAPSDKKSELFAPEIPAGPHAREELTDKDKTPGAGTLSEANEGKIDPGAG